MSTTAPPPDANPPAAPPSPRRPWYRLHASTWVVAGLVLAVFVLLNVPRQTTTPGAIRGESDRGWPVVYLNETVKLTDRSLIVAAAWGVLPFDDYPPWLRATNWRLPDKVGEFNVVALSIDLGVAAGTVALVATAFEYWRRRHRQAWQFHLADLIGATLIVALGAWWWASWIRDAEAESRLLRRLANLGTATTQYVGPDWVRRLCGWRHDGQFIRAVSVSVQAITDDAAETLVAGADRLQFAKKVFARGKRISNDVVRTLGHCRQLKTLTLDRASIDDSAVASLAGLYELTSLTLSDCPVSGAAFAGVHSMRRLEKLTLSSTNVTDDTIQYLVALDGLTYLNLAGTRISDAALPELAKMTALRDLLVTNTRATSAGVERLRTTRPDLYVSDPK